MGMTYDEISGFGHLRQIEKCVPQSMFTKLLHQWGSFLSPIQLREACLKSWFALLTIRQKIAEKVKHFFFEHARNRHKMTILTPSYHAVCHVPKPPTVIY